MYNCHVSECGGTFSGREGVISDTVHHFYNGDWTYCVWNINGPPGKRISLHFDEFDLAESAPDESYYHLNGLIVSNYNCNVLKMFLL